MANKSGPSAKTNPRGADEGRRSYRSIRTKKAFSWGVVSDEELAELVTKVTGAGHGVIFGTTSDGGAGSITVIDGDELYRDYVSSSGDFSEVIAYIRDMYTA
jgi:hypothetical protein